ncbi:hypothetical protein [uncultured Metabacillus sp.]|uniref:hypothetical protein n=1 Tax=uncultured Metabacillus sp. TaxID=2860135 RepID=UPI0026386143|nr:hypothetical protein [uncultured Metabacillus sp.]
MKKISKKDMYIFNNDVLGLIKLFGAVESDYYISGGYELNTELGKYYLKIDDDLSSVYSIFGRFENVEKASKMLPCNPYNGKYNFHSFNREECIRGLETMLERFAYELEPAF